MALSNECYLSLFLPCPPSCPPCPAIPCAPLRILLHQQGSSFCQQRPNVVHSCRLEGACRGRTVAQDNRFTASLCAREGRHEVRQPIKAVANGLSPLLLAGNVVGLLLCRRERVLGPFLHQALLTLHHGQPGHDKRCSWATNVWYRSNAATRSAC